MPSYVTKQVFDKAIHDLQVRIDGLGKPPASNGDLERRVAALEADVAALKTQVADQATAISANSKQLDDHEKRIAALEPTEPPPPDGGGDLPVAECTATSLASPPAEPFTMRLEAVDQGPEATYTWKTGKNTDEDPAEDIVTGPERTIDVVYPHEGQRTVVLTVTTPAGTSEPHSHTFVVPVPDGGTDPEPPDGGGGGETTPGEHVTTDPAWDPDLVDTNFDQFADTTAMLAARQPESETSMFGKVRPFMRGYEDDVSPASNGALKLVVNSVCGVKACRSEYIPPGGCGSVSRVTWGVGWEPAKQRVFAERVQMLSPNFNAHDPLCGVNPGDFKNEGLDTVGDVAGNFRVMACNSSNNANPLGTPAFNTPDPDHNDVYANVEGITVPVGQRFAFLWDVKCSSTPTATDGHIWVGFKNFDTGTLKVLHKKTGLSMQDGTVADKLLNKLFWCHNLDRAKPESTPLWDDTFSVKVGTNRPAWAELP